jgi:hypothetical protein
LAAPIVFALAFAGLLAFISLVLPFWILVAIGTLIGAGIIGAALGDWVSYWLGYHYHTQIARMWPLSKHPDLMVKGIASLSGGAYAPSCSDASGVPGPPSRLSPESSRCRGCGSRSPTSRQRSCGRSCCSRPGRLR